MSNTNGSIITGYDKVEIEKEINVLANKKGELSVMKKQYELKLGMLKSKIRIAGVLPQDEYEAIKYEQIKCKNETYQIDERILAINDQIKEKNTLLEEIRVVLKDQDNIGSAPAKVVADQLINLRDKYMEFSSDTTRVSSTRIMASKFSEELNSLLKMIRL